jgi:hypothetical protein
VSPQLEEVVGAAQQFPLRLAGALAAPHERAGALLLVDLAEARLDGLPALGVAGLAVLRDLPWRPCLAGGISSSGALGIAVRLAIDQ